MMLSPKQVVLELPLPQKNFLCVADMITSIGGWWIEEFFISLPSPMQDLVQAIFLLIKF
jgi:hypothetical protein